MAITLADFNKIWASTSPLTPYSFSEANYKQGWNFIGSTPPARQMWDFLQKNNDEKMQYLANNYLPLSGGTLTGDLTVSGTNKSYFVKHTDLEHGVNPTANNDKYFINVKDNTDTRLISFFERVASNGDLQLRFFLYSYTNPSSAISFNFINTHDGAFKYYPGTDNVVELGASNFRWKQLYAGTTTISTSDERLKDNIEPIPDEVLDAWGEVNWYQYQFKDSITEKGEKARLHTGAIAQRIESVFESHGLDANRYGLLCYDEWEAEEESKDEEGNVITEAREAGNCYSLRYEEALCMEAAYQRRRADRLEERIEALEKLLMNRTE